ncbi:MAG: hypothetical protein IPF98_22175 [Gemmatimonadetes bacterium]|nr:hypothetical protein [Gemmatimonadota bacterium]MCC6774743.1 hypothetical protein [Gemmatimonadaceae bacterium]
MLTSCAWCNTTFPANDGVEFLPIGRRIAFDEAKGRLWVVCRRCERWNLTPIERRWEALEECARSFRDSRLRASSDQVGLARLRDGTDLVRIGAPPPTEFAAWRYGDQFGRRRARAVAFGVGGSAAVIALAAGAVTLGGSLVALLPFVQVTTLVLNLGASGALSRQRPVEDPSTGGSVIPIGHPKLVAASDADGGWGLELQYSIRADEHGVLEGSWWQRSLHKNSAIATLRLVGPPARQLLARHAPRLNRIGAPSSRIQGAVHLIAEAGGADELPLFLARHRSRFTAQQTYGDSGELPSLPAEVRLALEMASHEEVERAILAGELAGLEAQWRGAEEEAAISDDLLLPPGVRESLARLRATRDTE